MGKIWQASPLAVAAFLLMATTPCLALPGHGMALVALGPHTNPGGSLWRSCHRMSGGAFSVPCWRRKAANACKLSEGPKPRYEKNLTTFRRLSAASALLTEMFPVWVLIFTLLGIFAPKVDTPCIPQEISSSAVLRDACAQDAVAKSSCLLCILCRCDVPCLSPAQFSCALFLS